MPARCAACNRMFSAQRSTAAYCSDLCRKRAHRAGERAKRIVPIAAVFIADLPPAAAVDAIFGSTERWSTAFDRDELLEPLHVCVRGTPPIDLVTFVAVRADDAAYRDRVDNVPRAIVALMRAPYQRQP